MHHEALKFDIGVYFEANGHGTIIYSDKAKASIKAASTDEGYNLKPNVQHIYNIYNELTFIQFNFQFE